MTALNLANNCRTGRRTANTSLAGLCKKTRHTMQVLDAEGIGNTQMKHLCFQDVGVRRVRTGRVGIGLSSLDVRLRYAVEKWTIQRRADIRTTYAYNTCLQLYH